MIIKGIGASPGIAIYPTYQIEEPDFNIKQADVDNIDLEIARFEEAIALTVGEIKAIKKNVTEDLDENHLAIFDAHVQIAEDPEIKRQVIQKIQTEHINAEFAYNQVINQFITFFEEMEDSYFKERSADIKDVSKRLLAKLLGITLHDPSMINKEVILIAKDLTPSDTAQLPKKFVKGFITDVGGRTSHSAIMARSLEIPAIVGTKNITTRLNSSELVIIDGAEGVVIINPTQKLIAEYQTKQQQLEINKQLWRKFKTKQTVTKDSHYVELAANIGNPDDMSSVLNNGAEGIGLYRTEFLYMNNKDFPSESEQFNSYKTVLEQIPDKKVVIRTLDIGGDKQLDYLTMDKELNPFLGHRALRLCLENIPLFKTQLRALLRAGLYGNLHIMFPMVATLDELHSAKSILNECKEELQKENIPFNPYVKVGIMIEIPSVAILADQFAKEVDFFSIGTNDLIQYTFAAGRMNQKVSYLYQPFNPSLLRLIKLVIDAAHNEGIWTGMCGEMAGDEIAAPILLGLGLDEFSMSATSILKIRHLFSLLEYSNLKEVAESCLNMRTNQEVFEYVSSYLNKELTNKKDTI